MYLVAKSNLPWCILGDFNNIMYASDKKGNHAHPHYLLDGLCRTIKECQLMELELKGGNFTCKKSRGSKDWVRERLDRAFASVVWWLSFLCVASVCIILYARITIL